jgi:hypothetical protein
MIPLKLWILHLYGLVVFGSWNWSTTIEVVKRTSTLCNFACPQQLRAAVTKKNRRNRLT